MKKNSADPVHCWVVWMKAFQASAKYLYAGLEETGLDDTDFRILEALLNKGPLPVNTIGPKVNLTPDPSVLPSTGWWVGALVTGSGGPKDRRVGVVSLTQK